MKLEINNQFKVFHGAAVSAWLPR